MFGKNGTLVWSGYIGMIITWSYKSQVPVIDHAHDLLCVCVRLAFTSYYSIMDVKFFLPTSEDSPCGMEDLITREDEFNMTFYRRIREENGEW